MSIIAKCQVGSLEGVQGPQMTYLQFSGWSFKQDGAPNMDPDVLYRQNDSQKRHLNLLEALSPMHPHMLCFCSPPPKPAHQS